MSQELEKIQKELDEEGKLWEKSGMSVDMTVHSNGSLFLLKQEIQAMVNVLLIKNIITEDEINIQLKTLMLNEMRSLRKEFGPAIEKAKIAALMGRPQEVALPTQTKLFGPDGKEVKL